jgi:3-methyladenine DNA glycosylase AlkD
LTEADLPSAITKRAAAFVAEHTAEAQGLGRSLADLVEEPEDFVVVLREGLARLADEDYALAQERIVPGAGPIFGVRSPLLAAISRQIRPALKEAPASVALWLAERLATEEERELVLFSHVALARALPDDPERVWQLMRRLARRANEWVSVDELATLFARGIVLERFRWAELEQLIYSADKWERRLVGATIARLPFELPKYRRSELSTSPGLMIIKSLIGDSEPDVQKALSWALRSWNEVDSQGVAAVLRDEAEAAARTDDGNRAWVIRDALTWPSTDPRLVAEIRRVLNGVRRRPGGPSTSVASAVAGAFTGLDRLTEQAVAMQGDRQRLAGR